MKPNWIEKLGDHLAAQKDESRGAQMKAYLRDQFEFFGIKAPERRVLQRNFLKENPFPCDEREKLIPALFEKNEREYQYFAMELHLRCRKSFTVDEIALIRHSIEQKSWWDTVDYIAAWTLGEYMKQFPAQIEAVCKEWMASGNFWLQRSCLLFQLKYKDKTDIELLFRLIRALMHEKEFFIRKAIGWSLREYAKTNPDMVMDFVENHPLQPLSKKEALKNIKC
jgi:3-methyladenine DNA glycosylase AlkD